MRPKTLSPVSPCLAERDAFDTLFDHAPDKLNVVKKVGTWLLAARMLCREGGGEVFEVSEMFATRIEA